MQKRIFSVWMAAVLLLLCLPFSASAEEVDSGPFPVVDAGFDAGNAIHILAVGEAFQKLSGSDYDTAMVYYSKNAEESPLITRCPITWDFEQIDSSTPGFYTLDGMVQLTDTLMPDENVYPDGAVTVPLYYYVYDPEDPATKLALEGVYPLNASQYNMTLGGDVRLLELRDTAYGYYSVEGHSGSAECGITWDYDSFDSAALGKQTLYGEIVPPEAFRLDEDSQAAGKLKVQCEIMVSDAQAPAETTIIGTYVYMDNRSRLIPLGMDEQALADSFEDRLDPGMMAMFLTEDWDIFECSFETDLTKIETTKVGGYSPLTILDFPAYAILDQTVKNATAVYVVDPNTVDLSCFGYDPSSGELTSSWIYSADAPALWAKIDGGDWEPVDNSIYTIASYLPYDEQVQELVLDVSGLAAGHQYEFEVRYEAGKYSVNTLVVDLSDGMFAVYDTPIDGDRHGYDRDDESDGDGDTEGTPGDGDTGNSGGSTPGNGDTGNSGGSTPGNGDTDNSGGSTPGNGDTDNSGGSTPGNGDTGNSDGDPDSNPQAPEPDHSDDGSGDAAQMPTEDSPAPKAEQTQLAQPESVTIAETEPPAAEKSDALPEEKPVAAVQTDLPAQPELPSSEDATPPPEPNALKTPAVDLEQAEQPPPAEITTARSEPVSSALPIVLGGGGLVCGAAFLWLRKRVKP